MSSIRYPKLRDVEVRPYHQNGQAYLLLRDPLELSPGALLVPQALGPLLALCDGTLEDAAAIHAAALVRFGLPVDRATVEELLRALDEHLILDSPRAREALEEARAAYRDQPFRPPALAGLSYPENPDDLARLLDDYLAQVEDPEVPAEGWLPDSPRPGVFSPHIDYPRGGHVYAQAWKAAAALARHAELVILVGTDHYGDDPFTLTRQHYATPYGVLPTATDLVDALAQALGPEAAFAGELRHRNEHSLELVAVWLHHMRGGEPVAMLPVLVGSLHRFFDTSESPVDADPQIRAFLDTLARLTADKRVLVVASGDLSHVGPAFGGRPLGPAGRARLRQADEEVVAHLAAGDAEGFFQVIRQVRNRHNICGTTPGYLTLKLMGEIPGHRAGYATCPADEQNHSVVTVAGIVYP